MSVRVEPVLAVGGFDPERGARSTHPFDRGEEEELQRRLAAAGWEIGYEPEAAVRHRGRSRREGAAAFAAALGRFSRFAAARAWSLLAGPRRPQSAGDAL